MTEKLVQEITHHIEAYNLFPTKIRFVALVFKPSVAGDLTPCPSEALRDNPMDGSNILRSLTRLHEKDIPSVTPSYFQRGYIHNS